MGARGDSLRDAGREGAISGRAGVRRNHAGTVRAAHRGAGGTCRGGWRKRCRMRLRPRVEERIATVEQWAGRIVGFGSEAGRASYVRVQGIASGLPKPDAGKGDTLVDGAAVQWPGATGGSLAPAAAATPVKDGEPRRGLGAWGWRVCAVVITGGVVAAVVAVMPAKTPTAGGVNGAQGGAAAATSVDGIASVDAGASVNAVASVDAGASVGAVASVVNAAPVCPIAADKDNACHLCRDQNCCAEYLACHNSYACGDYLDCTTACKTAECRLLCTEKYREGHAVASPYQACAEQRCAGPCAADSAQACAYCQESRCGPSIAQCKGDPACSTIWQCADACGKDAKCVTACTSTADPKASGKFVEAIACGMAYCSRSCQGRGVDGTAAGLGPAGCPPRGVGGGSRRACARLSRQTAGPPRRRRVRGCRPLLSGGSRARECRHSFFRQSAFDVRIRTPHGLPTRNR